MGTKIPHIKYNNFGMNVKLPKSYFSKLIVGKDDSSSISNPNDITNIIEINLKDKKCQVNISIVCRPIYKNIDTKILYN